MALFARSGMLVVAWSVARILGHCAVTPFLLDLVAVLLLPSRASRAGETESGKQDPRFGGPPSTLRRLMRLIRAG